jgi:hypothetical protein
MANLKHIGRVANTNVKCVVVFREIYDEKGNVIDPNNCLVVETERRSVITSNYFLILLTIVVKR